MVQQKISFIRGMEEYALIKNEIICNKCGKKFDVFDRHEGFSLQGRFGFGTKFDGENYELDLCCDCMEKLVEECVVSPIVEVEYDEDDEDY